jgi:predicted nuclease of predicted toxin-antitoxin system
MKIKLDENLPVRLTVFLASLHHDVHTVAEENLSGRNDRDVWEAAQRDERFLITQDLDFSDPRRFAQERITASYLFASVLRTARASSAVFRKCSSTRKSAAGPGVSWWQRTARCEWSGPQVEGVRSTNASSALTRKKGTAEAVPFIPSVFSVTP